MNNGILNSERCDLFKKIAEIVWKKIARAHKYNINLPEIGITKEIILELLEFQSTNVQGFDVYAKPGYNESLYGSDLDVFVETNPKEYRWFALQAKMLKKQKTNSRYTTLKQGYSKKKQHYQWEKLKLLEGVSGCKAFYLMYNGLKEDDSNFQSIDRTLKINGLLSTNSSQSYTYHSLGCSLVNLATIENSVTLKGKNNRNINPSFLNFHPNFADPWHVLVCCQLDKDIETYCYEEIIGSNGDRISLREDTRSAENQIFKKEDMNETFPQKENRIAKAMIKTSWDPKFRLVVRRMDNDTA
jgi:hypothetical protein